MSKDFATIATQYATDVVDGRILACKWVRLACRRHLDDLARPPSDAWPFAFNAQQLDAKTRNPYLPADRVCKFAELMPHTKGDWAARGERIRLRPWQVFILCSIFGWVNTHTGKRRFRSADVFVPRKNGKSAIAAVIGLYMLALDNEFGAEVYSGATSLKQAMEVFKPALHMVKMSAEFRQRYGIEPNTSNLAVIETNSKFEPVIGKPGDGASPSCAIVDEYHEHNSSDLYDTMATGMGARSQPLLLVITTSGNNIGGPCYTHQVELQKVLDRAIADETRFGIIYTVDQDDDWTSPEALIKANPNYGISVNDEFLLARLTEARNDPRKQNVFKTKHLNIWVNAASPWINVERLQAAGDNTMQPEDFRGESCWIGTDLASKIDIASKARVFRRLVEGEWHYYLFTRNYLPEAAIDKPENGHYQDWVNRGHLVQTSGNMIDLRQISDDIVQDADLFVIQEVAMDAWGSREIAPALQAEGFTVIDVPMTTRNLSEPMKLLAALIDAGRFHHDGNLATVWMFANVEVFEDRNENMFPRKASAERKIDAAVAAILAIGRAMVGTEHQAGPAFIDLNTIATA